MAGIGDECTIDDDCLTDADPDDDAGVSLTCLDFKGGYCGDRDCVSDGDCPAGSACVTHETRNYCFLVCADKPDCNSRRSAENEANCSANVEFTDGRSGRKVCVPPNGG